MQPGLASHASISLLQQRNQSADKDRGILGKDIKLKIMINDNDSVCRGFNSLYSSLLIAFDVGLINVKI